MVKTIILTVVILLLAELGVLIIGAFSGVPDVAATGRDPGFVRWFLVTTRDHSIAARAGKINAPPLTDSAMIARGAEDYDRLCIHCHSVPQREADEFAHGLNPPAPHLGRSTGDLSDGEIFLTIRDGIKMTGMPAFAPIRSDTAIWDITAFVKYLQKATPEHRERQKE